MRAAAFLLAGALAAATTPQRAAAQGSPYVPLDDPAYAYVDALVARGHLHGLRQLERPYTVAQLTRALAAGPAAAPRAEGAVAQWLGHLRERLARLAPEAPADTGRRAGIAAVAAIGARGTLESTTRRELLLADREGGAYPGGHVRIAAAAGPVVVAGRWVLDQRWREDPDYAGFTAHGVAGRTEEAYVGGHWRYGELVAGRVGRRLGPAPLAGLQVGGDVDSYDHLYGRFGVERLHLATMLARLDDAPGFHDPLVRRHLVVHRLAGRIGPVELAATETFVYSGADRTFEPALANPLAPVILTQHNDHLDGNVTFGVEALWRSPWGVLGAQAMLDDYQFERGRPETAEPTSYGATATAEGLPLAGDHRWFASYTRVSNLVYRSANFGDNHVWRGVSLGRLHADYDELRVGVELAAPWAPVRAYVARRRQGEGDYRQPFPAIADYPTTPGFLVGSVGTVTRVAAATAGASGGFAWRADVGYNRVSGAGVPVAGARRATPLAGSGLAGRLTVSVEPVVLRLADRPR